MAKHPAQRELARAFGATDVAVPDEALRAVRRSTRALRPATAGLPGPITRAAGVAVMWFGLALRVWAIAALGRAFRTTIEVDAGQTVVASGPYRWIRHPSYTGLLLIVAGFGPSTGNWLSFVACVALPLPAVVRRIHLEESELTRVLGAAYGEYASGRARLVPRLW